MKNLLLPFALVLVLAACGSPPSGNPDPDPDPDPDPGPPMGDAFIASQVALGSNFSLAIDDADQLWAWGANNLGQLGNGSTQDELLPMPVYLTTNVKQVAAGRSHVLALGSQNQVWGWGHNNRGQIGVGWPSPVDAETQYNSPQFIDVPPMQAVYASGDTSFALTIDGALWAWGDNAHAKLGDDSATSRGTPGQVEFVIPEGDENQAPVTITSVFPGSQHVHAIDTEGRIWYWGEAGFLTGVGIEQGEAQVPTLVSPLTNLGQLDISRFSSGATHVLAVDPEGALYTWGGNSDGQLSLPEGTWSSELPTRIGDTLGEVTAIAAGGTISAAVSGGRVYTWGTSFFGELGDGSTDGTTSRQPTPIPGLENVVAVVAVSSRNPSVGGHVMALTSEGHVYTWGRNNYGQLGTGDTTDAPTPQQLERNLHPAGVTSAAP